MCLSDRTSVSCGRPSWTSAWSVPHHTHVEEETMMRLLSAAALAAVVTILPNPVPADAAPKPCLREAIDSCDADFPGETPEIIAIRGYCYMIRAALCAAGF